MQRKNKILIIAILIIIITTIQIKAVYAENKATDITATFKDENLKNAILDLAKQATGDENKTAIYQDDIEKIAEQPGGTSLRLANKGITDLSGIEVFADKDITWIFLDWNEISSLEPLKNFSKLTKISFSGNKVQDLSPLAQIENLENITAINNQIQTIESLKTLTNMKYICLDENKLTNINTIKNWKNIIDMSFTNNKIEAVPDITQLTALETINLSGNNIKTLSGIGTSKTLTKLEIDNNQIDSLAGIEGIQNLEILSCSNNQIEDIEPLENLQKLENLNINKNQIQNIQSAEKNQAIKYIYMDNNSIFKLGALEKIPNLKKYSIYNQNLTIEIKEKLKQEKVSVPLPELYENLYKENSFLYSSKYTTKVTGTDQYKIDEKNQNIELNSKDLQNSDISIEVADGENTILNYTIKLDKTAPIIDGIENGETYKDKITPTSKDNDINTVELAKDGRKITYNLGEEINEEGNYILIVTDRAGNETKISFKVEKTNLETEEYKTEGNTIIGIGGSTSKNEFDEKLKANMAYKVYRNEKLLNDTDNVATGDKLITENGKTFYLIVTGDVNKDGKTNIKDIVKLRKYLVQAEQFDEYQTKAANLAKENKITVKSLVKLRKMLVN